MTIYEMIPMMTEKEWDDNRTSFGGRYDPKVREFDEKVWRTEPINAWFGQTSLYEEDNK